MQPIPLATRMQSRGNNYGDGNNNNSAGNAEADNDGGDGKKAIYSATDWDADLAKLQVTKDEMNKLIMNYLVIEGYKEAAEKFEEECGTSPGIDLPSISDRMATRVAIQQGDIQAAIERANDLNPLILEENAQLFFHLQQQKLIELIRTGDVAAALDFAEKELAPRGEENPQFLTELERTMALLAFDDKSKCPVADLLQPAQRQKTASELNAAILTSQCQEKDPKLPALLKMLMWAQDQLKQKADFPVLDIEKAILQSTGQSKS